MNPSRPHLPTDLTQASISYDAHVLALSCSLWAPPGARLFWHCFQNGGVPQGWRSPWGITGQIPFPASDFMLWGHRLVTPLARQLGDGTHNFYHTGPFGRMLKLPLLVLSIVVGPWAVIEITRRAVVTLHFWPLLPRRETEEGRVFLGLKSLQSVGSGAGRKEGPDRAPLCLSSHSQLIQPQSITLIQQQLK